MNRFFIYFLYLSMALGLGACAKDYTGDKEKNNGNKPKPEVTRMTKPEFIFGFIGENKYSYCPSVLEQEDGSVVMYFCGMERSGVMIDHIYHINIDNAGSKSKEKSVLQPGATETWDNQHTCDPSIIEGEFNFDGTVYKYAMFYLGCTVQYYYNEVGVAFSNDLNGNSWVKYPNQIVHKTWSATGDQAIGVGKSWGVGQPSAVSLDKKGKVLLTYTIGDIGGTRIAWREIDMSNMSKMKIGEVQTMITTGLMTINNTGSDYTCNADFAINIEEDKIVMVRPVQPHPADYPTFLPAAQEVNYMNLSDFTASKGRWSTIYRITSADTNYPRNHNSAVLRDNYGHIKDWLNPTIYFTISKAAPDVSSTSNGHAEWTYHIYKSSIYTEK